MNDNKSKSPELDARVTAHLKYAQDMIAKWPEWQKGLLEASGQRKLPQPRTVKLSSKVQQS